MNRKSKNFRKYFDRIYGHILQGNINKEKWHDLSVIQTIFLFFAIAMLLFGYVILIMNKWAMTFETGIFFMSAVLAYLLWTFLFILVFKSREYTEERMVSFDSTFHVLFPNYRMMDISGKFATIDRFRAMYLDDASLRIRKGIWIAFGLFIRIASILYNLYLGRYHIEELLENPVKLIRITLFSLFVWVITEKRKYNPGYLLEVTEIYRNWLIEQDSQALNKCVIYTGV